MHQVSVKDCLFDPLITQMITVWINLQIEQFTKLTNYP
jgi:hypothetical protein